MIALHKLSMRHVAVEDRLLLTGLDAEERVVKMWLTQRLVRRMLPVYLKAMGADGPSTANAPARTAARQDVAADAPPGAQRDEGRHEATAALMQGFAQQRARLAQEPVAAVVAQADSPSFLIHKVDIGQTRDRLVLTFVGEDETNKARFAMTGTAIRHWLNGLHDVCLKARWPLDEFPEWVQQAAVTPSAGGEVTVLH